MSNVADVSGNTPLDRPVQAREYLVNDGTLIPLGYLQVTGLSSVKSLTVPNDARVALLQAESQNIRFRDDGTNPTASVGMTLKTTADIWYTGDLSKLRFIESTASATLNVSFYR